MKVFTNNGKQKDSKLTGHGCLRDGQEERDGEGEGHVADDVWVEQRAGEHQHRGRQVDQVVGAQRHHQPWLGQSALASILDRAG